MSRLCRVAPCRVCCVCCVCCACSVCCACCAVYNLLPYQQKEREVLLSIVGDFVVGPGVHPFGGGGRDRLPPFPPAPLHRHVLALIHGDRDVEEVEVEVPRLAGLYGDLVDVSLLSLFNELDAVSDGKSLRAAMGLDAFRLDDPRAVSVRGEGLHLIQRVLTLTVPCVEVFGATSECE